MTAANGAACIPWLKIEHAGDRYQVHWRVERHYGRNVVVDLGHSQRFATESEAKDWCDVFESALAEDEPRARP
jgi:hypothetical protein